MFFYEDNLNSDLCSLLSALPHYRCGAALDSHQVPLTAADERRRHYDLFDIVRTTDLKERIMNSAPEAIENVKVPLKANVYFEDRKSVV